MRVIVTGAAGFIGSHLVDALVQAGHGVTAVDSFTPYYERSRKERHLGFAMQERPVEFLERSVSSLTAADLEGVDVVYHLAAQPGVRQSWTDLNTYLDLNLSATNALALACAEAHVPRLVFASSSSIYGDLVDYPTVETAVARPTSPYGVTKLAGENLLRAHVAGTDLTVVALRFFTVYGPGQRPDMATQRLVHSAIAGTPFTLFGDGMQRRDFTYVGDTVAACLLAGSARLADAFTAVNVGGTGDVSMLELIDEIERAVGTRIELVRAGSQRGDVSRTGADASRAADLLGWRPSASLSEGIRRHVGFELSPSLGSWRA